MPVTIFSRKALSKLLGEESPIGCETLIVRVLYFASFREITRKTEEAYHLPDDMTVANLVREATLRYPGLSNERIFTAVNNSIVEDSTILHDGDSVAVFPIVSGG